MYNTYCFNVLILLVTFLDAVFSLNPRELGDFGDHDCRPIPLELQMLFANMLLLDQSSVSTTKLTDSFGWNNQEVSVACVVFSYMSPNQLVPSTFTGVCDLS